MVDNSLPETINNIWGQWALIGYIIISTVAAAFIHGIVNVIFGVNLVQKLIPNKLKRKSADTKSEPIPTPIPGKILVSFDDHLLESIFFVNAALKLHSDIPYLSICPDKPIREQVYKDLIYMTVDELYCGFKLFIRKTDLESITDAEWGMLVRNQFHDAIIAHRNKAVDFGVPNEVIRHYEIWLRTYTDMVFREHIDAISHSILYVNNISRTATLLMVLNMLIISIIGDIPKLANDPNINISGIDYRGSPIEPLED